MVQYSQFLLLLVMCVDSLHSENVRRVPIRLVKFEKVCWQNAYAYPRVGVSLDKTRNKVVCGVKCTERADCVAFAYFTKLARCMAYPVKFTTKTESCAIKEWDYGELL